MSMAIVVVLLLSTLKKVICSGTIATLRICPNRYFRIHTPWVFQKNNLFPLILTCKMVLFSTLYQNQIFDNVSININIRKIQVNVWSGEYNVK